MKELKKRYLFLVFFTIPIQSIFCQNSSLDKFEPDLKTVIEIQALGSDTSFSYPFISYINPVTYREEKYFPTASESQKLRFEFKKLSSQDIQLTLGRDTLTLLVKPGEHLLIRYSDEPNSEKIAFSGSNAELHGAFQKLYKSLLAFDLSQKSILGGGEDLNSEEYKGFVSDYRAKWLKALEDRCEEYQVPKLLENWFRSFINYNIANHLYQYGWKARKEITNTDYWNFFDNLLMPGEHAISCTELYRFYNNYFIYLSSIRNVFSEEMKYYGEDWTEFYTRQIKRLGYEIKGIGLDILTAHLMYRFLKDDVSAFNVQKDKLLSKIENPIIRESISKKLKELSEQFSEVDSHSGIKIYDYRKDTISSNLFDILLNRYKGKVIFIDNWATWCGPCIEEMPHSKKLQQEFKNEDVTFVFLCTADSGDNDRAKIIISENQLFGEHYLMNFPQTISIQEKFSSPAIPRYLIIDQEGLVVDNDAPRPSTVKLREIFQQLLAK